MSALDAPLGEDLTKADLTTAVRQLVGNPSIDITSWTDEAVSWKTVSEATGSLRRVSGFAEDASGRVPWSLIIKTSRQPDGDEEYGWQREALVYTSGLVKPRDGFAIPRLLHVTRPRQHEVWLWLEDVPDITPDVWDVKTHTQVAFHLGLFNGSHRLSSEAAPPWLWTGWLAWWVSANTVQRDLDLAFVRRADIWQHPAVRAAFPSPVLDQLEFLAEHSAYLATCIRQLPQTLCHMDAGRFNLRIPDTGEGARKTVFLDWQAVSLGPLGTDLGMTNFLNLCRFYARPDDAQRLDEQTFHAYVLGLCQGGEVSEKDVRLAYTTTAALRTAVVVRLLIESLVTDQERQTWVSQWGVRLGLSYEQALAGWGTSMRFLLELGREAFELAHCSTG